MTELIAPVTTETATPTVTETVPTTTVSTEKTWRDDFLPEDIRNDPNFTKFESKESFAKSHLNLVKMIGSDKIVVPKEGDQAAWDAFFKAGGRPDTPDAKAYGFEKPTDLPAGLEYSEEQDARLASIVHKAGLNKSQAHMVRQEFIKYMGEGVSAQGEAFETSRATQETQIKTEWGRAYDQNMKEAKIALKEYGGDEFAAYLEQTGLGNHPAMIKAFHKIASKTMGEDKLIGVGGERENTPADLDKAIADYRQLHTASLFDASHPDHKLRTAEYTRLFEKRHG